MNKKELTKNAVKLKLLDKHKVDIDIDELYYDKLNNSKKKKKGGKGTKKTFDVYVYEISDVYNY